jgi:hypothetical protein
MGHVKSGAREKKVVSRERGEEWVGESFSQVACCQNIKVLSYEMLRCLGQLEAHILGT